ncbi:hypothetical protein BJ170DRAFT_575507 [Xylariales sp. AK1849]|nr:hypothetical protein BJ170DRAFT_575507 [Xylariales sp. AK1849]
MVWSTRATVSVIELVFYFPALIASSILVLRLGSSRSAGWTYTLAICLIRIIGSITQLVSMNSPSTGIITAMFILDSVGVSPLLFATIGLLSRYLQWVNAESQQRRLFGFLQFHTLHILVLVGLVLSIIGGTNVSPAPDGTIAIQDTTKVGVLLYLVALSVITIMLLLSISHIASVPEKERLVPVAVGIAIPFILVRVIYSILAAFLNNSTFSIVHGSVEVWTGMTVPEQFIVVIIYISLGFRLDQVDSPGKDSVTSLITGRLRKRRGNDSYNLEAQRH